MNQLVRQDRLVWSFWAAGAIAVVGGLLPLLIGGTSSRMATVIIPFAVAAGGETVSLIPRGWIPDR